MNEIENIKTELKGTAEAFKKMQISLIIFAAICSVAVLIISFSLLNKN